MELICISGKIANRKYIARIHPGLTCVNIVNQSARSAINCHCFGLKDYSTRLHRWTPTHRCLVQHFDGEGLGHVVFPQGLLQLLEREAVPLPKHHQVNVTVGGEGITTRNATGEMYCTMHKRFFEHGYWGLPCRKIESCAKAAKYLDLRKIKMWTFNDARKKPCEYCNLLHDARDVQIAIYIANIQRYNTVQQQIAQCAVKRVNLSRINGGNRILSLSYLCNCRIINNLLHR